MGSKSPSTLTTTTSPPAAVLKNYQNDTTRAAQVASTPYQAYQGELVAGINQGQSNAIDQLQNSYGVANPYLNAGSGYLSNASSGLGGVQNYLQAGSQATAQGQQYSGLAAGLNNPNAYQQYYSPYQSQVIDSTRANLQANDQIQAQGLASNAIGSGSFGGDRAGIAQADLSRQQGLADGQTIAGLENQGYNQSVSQAQQAASLYGNLASASNQSAGMYNTLGQTQGQTAAAQGTLAGIAGNLGSTAQSTNVAGASAALQGSTLQQQNQQQQDAAAYGQYQTALQYPFQTTSYLANIDQGIGANSGGSSTAPGASTLSQIVGAGTAGLGILGATGGISGLKSALGFARGGGVSGRKGFYSGGVAGRPHYLDGGSLPYGAPDASIPGTQPLNFSASGLLGGSSNPTGASQPMALVGNSPGGPQSQGLGGNRMPVLSAAPMPQQPPSNGLAGAAGAMSGAGAQGASGGLAGDNSDSNKWMGILAAGLGTMAGTSPYAMANIGQGGLAGLKEYQGLRQADRENALAASNIGYKNAELGLARQKADLEMQSRIMSINGARAAAGLPPIAGLGGAAPASGPSSAAASPSPGLAPSGSSSSASPPAMEGAAPPSSAASSDPGSSVPPGPPPTAAAVAPTSTNTGTSFWSGVDPESNPYVLNARARDTLAYGDTASAEALRTRAAKITDSGTVLMRDGSTATMPGYVDRVAAQKAAEAQGQEAGSSHTVYDSDGTPLLVDGKTYQQAAQTGTINGSPISAVQSPYNSADVDNYKEFSKNAISFNKDYQSNVYALNSLAHIYQTYQGGRGAEAIAELDSYAKQAGVEKMLPKGWQGTSAGFDAALKTVTAEGFKSLQDSGLTKAPATGLREVMLTVPRPDADPAARQKAITDALANLNYQHDMISNIAQSGDRNVLRAQNKFLSSNKFTDYVDAARAGTPTPTGTSPAQLGAVMGGTPASNSQQAAPSPTAAIPRPTDLVDGQVYMTRRGPARWSAGSQSFSAAGQ